MSIMSFFLTVYYAMLLGYSILYFVLSFRSKLEWATCGSWASPSKYSSFIRLDQNCFSIRLHRWFLIVHHALQLRKYLQRSQRSLLYMGESRFNPRWLVGYPKSAKVSKTCLTIGWLFQVSNCETAWSKETNILGLCFSSSNYILNKSQGIGYISTLEWPLVLSLLAAWVLVFICLCRGIKTTGKVRESNEIVWCFREL